MKFGRKQFIVCYLFLLKNKITIVVSAAKKGSTLFHGQYNAAYVS